MADVNYLNPASFMPANNFKADGPLGGVMWARQADDYQKLMQVQQFLQQLGAQRAQQEQSEFMEGAPVRAQERQLKSETLGGQIPLAREAASQTMQTGIAEQKYKRDTDLSDAKKQSFFEELKAKTNDREWAKWQKELGVGATLANQAMKIEQSAGTPAAIGWMQQQLQRAKQAGLTLPDQHFMDPKRWPSVYNSAVESIEHMQKLNQIAAKGNFDLEGDRIRAEAVKQSAQTRARTAAQDRPVNIPQRTVQLSRAIASGQLSGEDLEAAKLELRGYVMKDFETQAARDPMLKSLAETAAIPQLDREGNAQKKYDALYQQKQRDFLKRFGLDDEGSNGNGGNSKITIGGQDYDVLEKLPNGSVRIRDPKTGKTGTYKGKK